MRIICTLNDKERGTRYSAFLTSKGIENELEIHTNQDWGSSEYGDATCRIWVYDEDRVNEALKLIDYLHNNPDAKIEAAPKLIFPEVIDTRKEEPQQTPPPPHGHAKAPKTGVSLSCTTYIVLICFILFLIDAMTSPTNVSVPPNLPSTPFVSSELKKDTLFDYPNAYRIVDKAIKLYGDEALQHPQDLPQEGKYLLKEFYQTPYWHGVYSDLVHYFHHEPIPSVNEGSTLFERIREGEFWRLFTPCLMHNDILHILFNMLWLIVLGKQLEQRLGIRRYLALILFIGVFSNICQYLMSGPEFLGFSGVLCGMLTFIWVRQKIAPWEGYPLEKSTIAFMLIFIIMMATLQLISFFLENQYQVSISPGIANTAHLSGAILGLLLAYLPIFSWNWRSKGG